MVYKYNIGDCFKRMPEVTDKWNNFNLTTTIMIYDMVDGYYRAYSDVSGSIGITEEIIDKYFYRLNTREEVVGMLDKISRLP